MLASTLDFPMQSRVLEFVDEGNGFLSIYVTNLDHNSPSDSLAYRARELGAAKRAFPGFGPQPSVADFWSYDTSYQNLLLRVRLPEAVRARLGRETWPTRIESEATLQSL